MQGYIYLIENKINGKKYVGQTTYAREPIIKLYQEKQSILEVAKEVGCNEDTVKKILTDAGVDTLPHTVVQKMYHGHKIAAYDFKTGEFIASFNTQCEAGVWIIQQGKTRITNVKKLSYVIGRAMKGLDNRKQAYGYRWVPE